MRERDRVIISPLLNEVPPVTRREVLPYSIHSDFITAPAWLTMRSVDAPPNTESFRRLIIAPVSWEETIVIDPEGEGGIYPNNNEPLPVKSDYFTELTLNPYQLNNTAQSRAVHVRFLSPVGITVLHHPIMPNHMKRSGLKLPRSQKGLRLERLENITSDVRTALIQSVRYPAL